MKKILLILLLLVSIACYTQHTRKFKVEKLTAPTEMLQTNSYNDILVSLLFNSERKELFNNQFSKEIVEKYIVAKSNIPYKLLRYNDRPFFNGMLEAYAGHYPIVLSPDMIWLLICQGFSHHINNNSESLRNLIVDYEGKMILVVRNDDIKLNDPDSPWENVFPEFSKQIAAETGPGLVNALTCNFSTTTPISKVASEITIMDAFKKYFEYRSLVYSCGIPEITLEGTPQDWASLKKKAMYLKKYKLGWWIDEIIPILNEFEKSSKGHINKHFWKNMVNHHEGGACRPNDPEFINGWMIKFFPYNKYQIKNRFDKSFKYKDLPSEIMKVDLKFLNVMNNGSVSEVPLVLWAGFVGLEQDTTTYSLKPTIGWMIQSKEQIPSIYAENSNDTLTFNIKEVPDAILSLPNIKYLTLNFKNKIVLPEKLSDVIIEYLELNGIISENEITEICKRFTNTDLKINGVKFNQKNLN